MIKYETDLKKMKRILRDKEMKIIRDEDKYTTVKQSMVIQPIMDKLGIEPDAYTNKTEAIYTWEFFYKSLCASDQSLYVPVYRLDTLLWALPDWVFNVVSKIGDFSMAEEICVGAEICTQHGDLEKALADTIDHMVTSRGSEAIAAAVELIKLLDDNELCSGI